MVIPVTLAALVVGPIQFDRPVWLVLIPVLGALSWWIGRRSLAGLGGRTRWVALGARIVVIALISGALAEPSFRRVSDDVAVTVVLDASRSIPLDEQQRVDAYVAQVRERSDLSREKLGVVTVGKDAFVQSLPSTLARTLERQYVGDTEATNLAAGVRMAIAVAPEDAANRLLLVSDGNETEGSLLAAAEAARAAGIPIDVLPVQYEYPAEVIVDRVVAPANARGGETINLSVIVTATREAVGRLLVSQNGDPVDLDPDGDAMGVVVRLDEGKNVLSVPIAPQRPGPQTFEAVFEPLTMRDEAGNTVASDSILQNNRSSAVTFVGSEGWVLIVAETAEEYGPFERAMLEAGLRVVVEPASNFPTQLVDLNAYEGVVLLNQPAFNFSEYQQDVLRQYVHDSGGGVVMVGGPDAFGAGGWIGSPFEDALPVQLDPPQKRQMPRGALVLVMHSIEMPNGVYYGKQTANAAVDALSRLDFAGIIEFQGFGGGTDWVHPLAPVGDKASLKRAINNLQFGDMQTFDPSFNLALDGLKAIDAGQKHMIVISDGDPSISRKVLGDYRAAGVTISTVGVFPHSPGDLRTLQRIAETTGGKYYAVTTQAGLATLPQIFIKEAQTVRRSLIWEGEGFQPAVSGVPTETMRGISAVPAITGYVVTADREGLSLVTMRGKEEDPISAQWQYGLGRVVAFTSDATSRWAAAWPSWAGYKQFWEQHVRWAMRPAGSTNVRVITQAEGNQTKLIIEALDDRGERLNFADFRARVAKPGESGADVNVRQVGPGRYEALLQTDDPGSYVVSMLYKAPGAEEGAPIVEGSVQAAITRPFADEFRALETNTTLLRQVAAATGGRVLERNADTDELWDREGLEQPVALRTIWITVACIGIGCFLADVGVRRVRVDPAAMALAVKRAFGKGKRTGAKEEQLMSLREAREKARQRMAGSDGEQTAARKFEATAEQAAQSSGRPIALSGEEEKGAIEGLAKPKPKPKATEQEEEQGMSRLLKAKRRAQGEFGEDES